jgi:hypothetical protein
MGPDSNRARASEPVGDVELAAVSDWIEQRHNVLLLSWPNPRLARLLRSAIERRIGRGSNTVLLVENEVQLAAAKALVPPDLQVAGTFTCRGYTRRKFLDEVDAASSDVWFKHLDLIVVPFADDTFHAPFEWEHVCFRIIDRYRRAELPLPQIVLVCSPRNHAEAALRRNLPIFDTSAHLYASGHHRPHEQALSGVDTKLIWWTLWAAEQRYASAIFQARPDVDYGVAPVLAYFAGVRRVAPSRYANHPDVHLDDQAEALQNQIASLGARPPSEVVAAQSSTQFSRSEPCSGEVIHDTTGNPWRALRAFAERGGEAVLLGIACAPTLLRGYLIENAAYYASSVLEPLTPSMVNSESVVATQIYLRLTPAGTRLPMVEVRNALEGIPVADRSGHTFSRLRAAVESVFGNALASALTLEVNEPWSDAEQRFLRETSVFFRTLPLGDDADWLKGCRVVDEDGNDLDRLRLDHVQQVYPPGQLCAVGGKLYRVDAHERDAVRLKKASSTLRHLRAIRSVRVSTVNERRTLAGGMPLHARSSIFEKALYELAFTVEHAGTCVAADPAKEWQIDRFAEPFRREYRTGRALRLRLANEAGDQWTPSQTLYLAQWINEAALTLFPESHRFLIATVGAEDSERPTGRVSKEVVPRLSFDGEIDGDRDALWIFEDSHADLGIVGACYDRADWLLELCLDYLNWRNELSTDTGHHYPCRVAREGLAVDFLAYGEPAIDAALDGDGLRNCLNSSGLFDAEHGLTATRTRALSDAKPCSDSDDRSGSHCDFCDKPIEGEQAHRFDDGRVRCGPCGVDAVDTVAQARELSDLALGLLESRFSVRFNGKVQVAMSDARGLAHAKGEKFLPTDAFDQRAIGLAVAAHSAVDGGRFQIYVEMGHSRHDTFMTLVHELTHIWQFESLDYAAMEQQYGVELVEGHACWAELACASAMADTASSSERARWRETLNARRTALDHQNDEYGNGYRRLLSMAGTGTDAFEFLRRLYGRAR